MVSKLLKIGLRLTLSLLLLSTVINGNFYALEKKLKIMADDGKKINDLFVPSKNGTIKRGGLGLVFKGTKVEDGQSVALKFVKVKDRHLSDHEFRIYGYLNAINTTHVNKFGIPTLYYYNEWKKYMLLVLSLYDGGDLDDLSLRRYFNHENASLAINSFLLFRDFVIQSKYMHSRGVRHDDIKPENIVVQQRRSYLIDFNSASKMTQDALYGTSKFFARKLYNGETRTPKSDWESFLYTMAYINGIELGWLYSDPFFDLDSTIDFSIQNEVQVSILIGVFMKNNTQYIMSKIKDAPIAPLALKRVFEQFAVEALFNQNLNPSYDTMLEFIDSEMDSIFEPNNGKYNVFTWLKEDAKETASRDCVDVEIRNIYVPEDFEKFNYKEYSLDYFPKPIPKKRSLSFFGSCSGPMYE